MADPMRTPGVGSRWSVLVMGVAMLGGASACSTREAGARTDAAVVPAPTSAEDSTAGRRREPEQAVQNMLPKPPGSGVSTQVSGELPGDVASGETARSEAVPSSAPRTTPGETITSKHLEAELNRLEAELAN